MQYARHIAKMAICCRQHGNVYVYAISWPTSLFLHHGRIGNVSNGENSLRKWRRRIPGASTAGIEGSGGHIVTHRIPERRALFFSRWQQHRLYYRAQG